MIPVWLHSVSVGMLCLGAACAVAIAIDEIRKPQHVWIMNIAWPCNGALWVGGMAVGLPAVRSIETPTATIAFGWHTLFTDKIFAVWVLDYIFAYLFGIVFQYFTIAPMRGLRFAQGLWAAVKADTLSLTAWQIGMYGFMAIADFFIFRTLLGTPLKVNSAEFWFMMQIAMLPGFLTAYPVNWWLIRRESRGPCSIAPCSGSRDSPPHCRARR